MPRGFQSEEKITELLVKNKATFTDPRSEVVRDRQLEPHLILHGQDMSAQRERVMRRDRCRCQIKGLGCTKNATEVDHIIGGDVGRCDCLHNLWAVCNTCHRAKHAREVQL